jgi:transposase
MLTQHAETAYPAEAEVQQLLGWLYFMNEEYEQAAWYFRQVVAIYERASEPDQLMLAGCLADVACVYHKQDKYAEAEPFCVRALAIWEQLVGTEYRSVTTHLHNLGVCYHGQGKYTQAEPLLRRALEINQEVWGIEHSLTAISFNALGKLYLEQGWQGQAKPLLRQAFELCQKVLGAKHPRTIQALQDLIKLNSAQGQHRDAPQVSLDMLNNCERGDEEDGRCLRDVGAWEMRKHELTDEQWEKLELLLPSQKRGHKGRPAADHRTMINGMLWIDKRGGHWRDLPERYGKWQSVSSRFYRWNHLGIWQRVQAALQQEGR